MTIYDSGDLDAMIRDRGADPGLTAALRDLVRPGTNPAVGTPPFGISFLGSSIAGIPPGLVLPTWIHRPARITGWLLASDQPATLELDIAWADYASFPSLTSLPSPGARPFMDPTDNRKLRSDDVTGWARTEIGPDDWIEVDVLTVASCVWFLFTLRCKPLDREK